MGYTIDRRIEGAAFGEVVARTRAALAERGFGVLTEIDVQATMKAKLDAEMDPYLILGACNPRMAFRALGAEPRIGAMLPCNVILRGLPDGAVEVSAVDPVASMAAVENADLAEVAGKVREMLREAVEGI